MFNRLVTGTNELGEVRMHFYAVTDSQDQVDPEIKACKNICDLYGHHQTKHAH